MDTDSTKGFSRAVLLIVGRALCQSPQLLGPQAPPLGREESGLAGLRGLSRPVFSSMAFPLFHLVKENVMQCNGT